MPVIATAGHVDHGKSTLVRALTGRDPDRWEEEKRRGLTIDLGFAWTILGDREVGFIDVPGHERFLKNMLAGVDGANATLFVVAADEGWKPQSAEHLAVLDLLGIAPGVVALTRADLVDADRLELATLEVAEHLEGTSLSGSEVIATSAPSGMGMEPLRAALTEMARRLAPPDRGMPRLWIDRAFTIEGAGTVVTGTLVDGAIAVGDTLTLYPGEIPVRVRSLQVHERSVESAAPGNRTAINLSGADRSVVERGTMLGRPGEWRPTRRIVATFRQVSGQEAPRRDRGSFHLHAGSGAWPARLRTLDPGIVLIEVDQEIPLRAGDRFILREVGRQAVIGGGEALDPHPAGRTRTIRLTLPDLDIEGATPDLLASRLLAVRGFATASDLAADTGGGRAAGAVPAGQLVLSTDAHQAFSQRVLEIAEAFHQEQPFKAGVPRATLAHALGVDEDTLDSIIGALDGIVADGSTIRLADHRPAAAAGADPVWEAARSTLEQAAAAPPNSTDLGLHPDALGH
jgi:selenocysteine-specific elongation factor